MKSLVAEDDATSRKLLQAFLSRYGGCDIALDGEEAAVEDLSELAVRAAAAGNHPGAEAWLRQALELRPRREETMEMLVGENAQNGD